ncbi:MAG: VOC family protein [Duganella sp.]
MQLTPTVYLPGLCDEAIAFYRTTLDIEILFVRRIEDCIDANHVLRGTERKVLRAAVRIGQSVLYLSDGHGTGQPSHQGFSLSLTLPTLVDAERVFQALSEGGRILLPLRQTTWANIYGVLIDKFGLHWTVETTSIAQPS